MSKQPIKAATTKAATKTTPAKTTTPPKPKPKATFAAGSFGNLRAATGEGPGEALRILLADIDEDPNQPRKSFDQAELESMADSIKEHGVVQPIVVRPPVDGRYMLAFGARRFRASKLAGKADIPAVIRAKSDGDFTAQVIENQQRANLSNSELLAAIDQLVTEGKTNKQIASICALKDYQVAAFRQAGNFPPELAARMDGSDMRALYDLYRQWGKTPAEIIAGLPSAEVTITITEARRIIGSITGKPTGSIVLDRKAAPAPASPPAPEPAQPKPAFDAFDGLNRAKPSPAPAALAASEADEADEDRTPATPAPATAPAAPQAPAEGPQAPRDTAPVFIVQGKGAEPGRLVVDQRAEREGWALVRFPTGTEEVELSELRIVRIE